MKRRAGFSASISVSLVVLGLVAGAGTTYALVSGGVIPAANLNVAGAQTQDPGGSSSTSMVATLQSQVSTDAANMSSMQGRIAILKANVSSLETRISALKNQSANYLKQISSLQNATSGDNGQVAKLQGEVSADAAQIASLTQSLNSTQSLVTSLQKQLGGLQAVTLAGVFASSTDCPVLNCNYTITGAYADYGTRPANSSSVAFTFYSGKSETGQALCSTAVSLGTIQGRSVHLLPQTTCSSAYSTPAQSYSIQFSHS